MQKLFITAALLFCVLFSTNLLAYPPDLPDFLRDDYDQLEMLYKYANGDNWKNKEGWLSEPDMSKWYGLTLTADGMDVAEINLSGNLLSNRMPPSLGLPHVTHFDLSNNDLAGGISTLDMPELDYLDLSNNRLEKELLDFKMPRLTHLDVSQNSLSGRILEFSNLTNLTFFDVHQNKLEGEVPLLNMPKLETLNLSSNALRGVLPDFDFQFLKVLDVHANQFFGPIPTFKSTVLTTIDLSFNNFEGNIPNFDLPDLEILNLGSNKLTGSIPDMKLPSLHDLNIGKNGLEGEILNINFPNLVRLYVDNNHFKGRIPEFESTTLIEAAFNNNYFEGDVPTFEKSHLELLFLGNNRFVFGNFENKPWLDLPTSKLEYSNQAQIPISFSGQYLSVETGSPEGEQDFNWYKNGVLVATTNARQYQPTSSGIYACQISHKDITVPSDALRNLVLATNTYAFVVLAVELTAISATPLSNSVQIDWQTASEKNSDYFEIEQSLDGKNFQKIGSQKAVGNNNATNYTFVDTKAVEGIQYYRLKMVEIDERAYYSNIVGAMLKSTKSKHPLSILPNPATDNVRFQVTKEDNATATLEIFDILGRAIFHATFNQTEVIEWQRGKAVNGIYFTTLTIGNQQFIEKLILR